MMTTLNSEGTMVQRPL